MADSQVAHPNVPSPDPSILTTDALHREIAGLRELIEARITGVEKSLELLRTETQGFMPRIDLGIHHLQELHNEKFRSVHEQFQERDTRAEQTSRDSKIAIDAALQAAKEAVSEQNKSSALAIGKSETSITKQIDGMGVLIQSSNDALNSKIDDIKSRLTLIEGKDVGHDAQVTDHRSSTALIIATISSAVGTAGFVAMVIRDLHP